MEKICEHCGTAFRPTHEITQRYCCRRCRNNSAQIRFRERHPDYNMFHNNTGETIRFCKECGKQLHRSQAFFCRRACGRKYRAIRRPHAIAKKNELRCLLNNYGTSKVHLQSKILLALAHIGRRIGRHSNTREIGKEVIKETINKVIKGETYAAYE